VVVKLSWSIVSLTRGFSGLNSDTPRSGHPVTGMLYLSDKDENAQCSVSRVNTVRACRSQRINLTARLLLLQETWRIFVGNVRA
jgi:hypothetical protein